MEYGSRQHGDGSGVAGQLPMPLSKFQSNVISGSRTLGSVASSSVNNKHQVISEKKMFEGQDSVVGQHQLLQVKPSLPVTAATSTSGSSTASSTSSVKKFFGRNKDTISHGSFRSSKRKQMQQEAAAEHPKVTVDALKETPPLRKRVARARRARLRPLVHFDHQSIPIVVGALPSNINQFEQRGNCKSVTGASAAHATVYEDLATFRDHGDKISNELVLSCPYFRNEIGGEWLGGSSTEAQFRRSLSDDLKGVAVSLVEQLVYEGPHMISRDELLMNLKNTTVHSPKLSETLASDQISLNSFCYFEENRKPLEYIDYGALYYRTYFTDKEHTNFFGIDDTYGPIAISLRRERMDEDTSSGTGTAGTLQSKHLYRIIVRTCQSQTIRGSIPEDAIPASSKPSSAKGLPPKDIIEHVCPEFSLSCLRVAKQDKKVQDELTRLDEQELNNMYKIGLLYCKNGQALEEEMYNNATASPELDEFLDFIGDRVRMKGFDGYRAQLDNKTDTTGEHSIYTEYNNCEIMFHVSTLLPYQDNHKQQLLRKRHIGNDIVTVIFQDPEAKPFCAKNIRSQFQHVFVVVRCIPSTENKPVQYKVSVTRSYDVPFFGPPIPKEGVFEKNDEFRNFLLAKLINAENAGHHSKKFNTMATRTRRQYLMDLANSYSSSQSIEQVNVSRFDSILVKKKRKTPNVPMQSMLTMKGALSWTVSVLLKNEKPISMSEDPDVVIDCYLAISLDSLVLIYEHSKELLVHIPTSDIISWYQEMNKIMLFYASGHVICMEVCPQLEEPSDDVTDQCRDIIKRLQNVNPTVVEAELLNLFRGPGGRLGFTIERDGFVSDVLDYAVINGLQPGCRIVLVENTFVSSSSHDDILSILKSPINPVRVLAVPQTRRSTSHTHYRPFVMLREQIDWPTVWSLRPSSMDGGGGGGRSRTSTSQLTEHRRPSDPVTLGELMMPPHGGKESKLKLPEKRKVSKRPFSYLAAMDSPNDPMFDVMQTITEPSTDDSYPTSPMPGSDDGHDHTVKRPSGQDGMTGHFKKRKPMKPTSRTSINNIVDNKMEYDTEFDRQSPSPGDDRIPRVAGSLKLSQIHHGSPRFTRDIRSTTTAGSIGYVEPAKNRASSEEVFQQFTTCSEPTSPLRTSMQQQQPLHKLGQPSSFLSTSWERGKVNQLIKRYSSSSSNSSQTPRGSHSDVRLKRSGSEDSSTIVSAAGLSSSSSAPNNISVEVGGRPRSWLGDTRESSAPLDHHIEDSSSKLYPRRTPPSSLPHDDSIAGDLTPTSEEFVRKSQERVAMRRKKSETGSSPTTPSNQTTVEQGYGLDDDNALSLKKMSVKDRTKTWERRTTISQAAASAGMSYDTLKRLSSTSSRTGSPGRQIPSLQRAPRGRSESISSFSDMDQTDGGHLLGGKSRSPNPTASSVSYTTYHSYTLPKASMSSSKPPLPYSSPGKLHPNRSDRSFSSSENLAKHISEQLKLPQAASSISEEPDEDEETDGGKTAARRASAEARMTGASKAGISSGIPVMSNSSRSVTPNPPSKSKIDEESSPQKSTGNSRSQKASSGIPVSSRRTPSPLVDNRNNTTAANEKSKPSDPPTTDTATSRKATTIPRTSGPSSSSGGHGNSQYRRSSGDLPNKGNSSKMMSSSGHSSSDASQQQQTMSLAARRLHKASSLSNIANDPDDNTSSPSTSKLKTHSSGTNIPRPSSSSTPGRLHPLVIKTPQAMISGGGYAPLTIEELVSSPRILPHQHQNKVPPQASFPLKASSSLTASNELKEHTPAKNTVTKSVSSTTTVTMTAKVTCDDAAGENGEPELVGGVGTLSERPGSAHDGSESDSQPEYVPTDDEEDEGSSHLGSGDYPELVDLQAEVSKLKLDLEKEKEDKEELEEVVKLLQKENKILRQTRH